MLPSCQNSQHKLPKKCWQLHWITSLFIYGCWKKELMLSWIGKSVYSTLTRPSTSFSSSAINWWRWVGLAKSVFGIQTVDYGKFKVTNYTCSFHTNGCLDVVQISCYDTAGSVLLLGCTNGCIYYIDMQKFPLRMKDNDLLITELYRDPNIDTITVCKTLFCCYQFIDFQAISVYLTPKTNICGNWIEIAYGTQNGNIRLIVQHPETVGHGPQLFQTYSVHNSPIAKVALTTNSLISVCQDNHVRTWSVTRFRGMISTQPGGQSLASFKVLTLDSMSENQDDQPSEYSSGPYGDQDADQIFVQRVIADTNTLFIRLASTGERLCTIKSIDGSMITAFYVHECEGSNRMGARRRCKW